MNTKAIIAGTLFTTLVTALVAGQSAFAGQDNDQGVFATNTQATQTVSADKVNYDAPSVTNEVFVSGRK
ncbi:hypothetical protein OO007_13415 [Cocleimonas sp. KMM 6892]|uniref:hypothetical protein n=1 Tax=unclassified Cocleimonas TaxID=2639732 RepID=UPI002DB8E7EC|nr:MULTISPECIES: hypothetical protein [unclassified Cocleimonas]MEB8433231.1 hypothetical protein [Cocleimonas sp. KMM 6892]MEC4715788.1 hypothetical protein [Cocleimonas sp. KMM 6895]MEC4745249.1 hypothetical protein [Cocleimonas sp. KMM 6896]